MSELPTTEELAARLERSDQQIDALRIELDAMQSLAQQAAADYSDDWSEEDSREPELVAADVPRATRDLPSLPPPPRQQRAPDVFDQQQLASQAVEIAAASLPDWPLYEDRVMAAATASPQLLETAFRTGDPTVVAAQLANAYRVARIGEESMSMKLAAQTMSGGGRRPLRTTTDQEHWSAVQSARRKSYWEK